MIYRTAGIPDIGQLTELRIAYIEEEQGTLSDADRNMLAERIPRYFAEHLDKDAAAFVAEEAGVIVSTALLVTVFLPANPHFIHGKTGEVLSVYTKKEFRHKGIATRIMENLIAYAREQELDRIDLSATADGLALYRKVGFKELDSPYTAMRLMPAAQAQDALFKSLDELGIKFQMQEHIAIFSEKDSEGVQIDLPGTDVKNLFVKDKDGNYALVSMNLHRRADLKKIAAALGFGRLSFCNPEELMRYLRITPGSVSPLCIMADTQHAVKVLFDRTLCGSNVIVHPLRNTASVSISFEDLCRFVRFYGHDFLLADVCQE